MEKEYSTLWAYLEGSRGWDDANEDIKELVTDPLAWATNAIEYATQNHEDTPGVTDSNEAAWDLVEAALDVLTWLTEEEEEEEEEE